MSFLDLIAQHAKAQPGHIVLRLSNGTSYTYMELNQSVREVQNWLSNERIKSGTIILDLESEFEYIVCLIACVSGGFKVLPFYKNLHHKERQQIIAKIQPSVILSKQPSGKHRNSHLVDKEKGEILHFTSGSFGVKKIVVRPYHNLVDEAFSVATTLGITGDDVVLVASPLAHSFGCGMLRAVLCAGATLALSSSPNINGRVLGIKKLLQEDVSIITGVPYIYELLVRGKIKSPPRRLKRCFAGGAPLKASLSHKWDQLFHSPLRQEYGLGEGGITTLGNSSDPPESIGSPVRHVRLTIDNPNSTGIGELIIYRPYAPTRYLFHESPDTFRCDGGINSGDLVYQDGDGRFYFAGRIKSIINVAGMKVNPIEIESCLLQHSSIDEVVVFGVEDSMMGEKPIAFVKQKHKGTTEKEYRRFLACRLSKHKLPKRILFVCDWPMTESGKIDFRKLKALL